MKLPHATTLYAFWGNRREGLEAAAVRMATMLDELKPVHPAFERWLWQNPQDGQWVPYGGQPRTIRRPDHRDADHPFLVGKGFARV